MQKNQVILLCNNKIAVPAMRELLFYGQVAAIVVPASNKDLLADIEEIQAESSGPVPVIPVTKKNFASEVSELIREKQALACIIMTFPFFIPKELLSLPPKGFINFHYGRLPQYRGPEPIFNQVAKQEKNPGLTIHVVTEELDAGPIILEETLTYNEDDTYGLLQKRLAESGAKLISILMKVISFGTMIPCVPQDETQAAYHTKPAVKDLMIDWEKMDSAVIKALVNACNPWNKGCGAAINGWVFGVTEVSVLDKASDETPAGTIIHCDGENGLVVKTKDEKLLKLTIVYLAEGFFSGGRLISFGIKPGMKFD